LLSRPASQETLEKLTTALDDAHTVRARLGDGGERDVIGPDDIDKLRDPSKRLAAWRRLIGDTVELVTVAPAMTADGRPSRLWDPRRIDIRLQGQHPSEAASSNCQLRRPPAHERGRACPGRARSWITPPAAVLTSTPW